MKKPLILTLGILTGIAISSLGHFLSTTSLLDTPLPQSSAFTSAPIDVSSFMGGIDSDATVVNAQPQTAVPSSPPSVLNPNDSIPLLRTATSVLAALRNQDYAALASMSSQDGVTFTPYSTVNLDADVCLSPAQIKNLTTDNTLYNWGLYDGRGDMIQMTIANYFDTFVFPVDYSLAPEIAVDKIVTWGNALENMTEVYSDCRFVDYCYTSIDPALGGMDWTSLRLVFRPTATSWMLVGIVHAQWTI